MQTLTPRQSEVVAAVARLTRERGYPASLAELAKAIGTSVPAAKGLADAAVRRGYLMHEPRTARSLRVLRPA